MFRQLQNMAVLKISHSDYKTSDVKSGNASSCDRESQHIDDKGASQEEPKRGLPVFTNKALVTVDIAMPRHEDPEKGCNPSPRPT
ncbi:MAG: hypothetical protein M1434_15285 [Chloroflexi bacterium]|nr:hypothetical protein [Chloroflexota bacterium]